MVTDHGDLVAGFEACTLESFHHADHVRVAWSYLQQMPMVEALLRFQASLKRFAAHNAKPGLYHETITCAYVVLAHQRMHARPAGSWDDFSRDNPDLLTWRPSILDRYYHPETLSSELARRIFVLPDRGLH